MRKLFSLAVSGAVWLAAGSAVSHHSFSAEFDVGRPVEFTGTVTAVEWTNPHAWIFFETEDDSGTVQSWAVELLGINTLMRRGLTPNSIRAGDVLEVEGYGARDGTNTANASVLRKPDTGEAIWASTASDRN